MSKTASNVVPGPRPAARRGEVTPIRGRTELAPVSCASETPLLRMSRLAESLRAVNWAQITLTQADEQLLPAVIEEARASLAQGHPWEVLAALQMIAERRNLCLPSGLGLEMDVEIMSAWPEDLFRKAVRGVWEHFRYARFPEVPDFREHIAKDLVERQEQLMNLELLEKKLAMQRSGTSVANVRTVEDEKHAPRQGRASSLGETVKRLVAASGVEAAKR